MTNQTLPAQEYEKMGDLHLKFVQVLNDLPGCIGTTAEDDEARVARGGAL